MENYIRHKDGTTIELNFDPEKSDIIEAEAKTLKLTVTSGGTTQEYDLQYGDNIIIGDMIWVVSDQIGWRSDLKEDPNEFWDWGNWEYSKDEEYIPDPKDKGTYPHEEEMKEMEEYYNDTDIMDWSDWNVDYDPLDDFIDDMEDFFDAVWDVFDAVWDVFDDMFDGDDGSS